MHSKSRKNPQPTLISNKHKCHPHSWNPLLNSSCVWQGFLYQTYFYLLSSALFCWDTVYFIIRAWMRNVQSSEKGQPPWKHSESKSLKNSWSAKGIKVYISDGMNDCILHGQLIIIITINPSNHIFNCSLKAFFVAKILFSWRRVDSMVLFSWRLMIF